MPAIDVMVSSNRSIPRQVRAHRPYMPIVGL
jgi:hypothetical protein